MTDLKQIAKSFNMSVSQFAKKTGYTRQALYQALENGVCSTRLNATIDMLKMISDTMYNAELEKVQLDKKERDEQIKAISNCVGKIN